MASELLGEGEEELIYAGRRACFAAPGHRGSRWYVLVFGLGAIAASAMAGVT